MNPSKLQEHCCDEALGQGVRGWGTSSMNIIEGAFSLARVNSELTSFSLSPIHFDTCRVAQKIRSHDSAPVPIPTLEFNGSNNPPTAATLARRIRCAYFEQRS